MRGIMRIFGLAAVMVTAFACTNGTRPSPAMSSGGQPAHGAIVKIDNFSFCPQQLTIHVGTTVTCTNNDDVTHFVTSDDNITLKSNSRDTQHRCSVTFTKPGTYNYY